MLKEQDFYTINEELKKYSEKLSPRKQIIVVNQIDIMQDEKILKSIEELAKKENLEIYKISGVTGQGVQELIDHVAEVLKTLPKEDLIDIEERMVYELDDEKDKWTIRKEKDEFIVEGKAVERLMGRINIEDNESMYYLQKCLKNMGIEDELIKMGVKEGDSVKLADWELEWY